MATGKKSIYRARKARELLQDVFGKNEWEHNRTWLKRGYIVEYVLHESRKGAARLLVSHLFQHMIIEYFAVEKKHRKKGIGKELCDILKDKANKLGYALYVCASEESKPLYFWIKMDGLIEDQEVDIPDFSELYSNVILLKLA